MDKLRQTKGISRGVYHSLVKDIEFEEACSDIKQGNTKEFASFI